MTGALKSKIYREWINDGTRGSSSVVEMGAGFFTNFKYVHAAVPRKVGIEIWRPYVDNAKCQPDVIKVVGDVLKFEDLLEETDRECCLVIDVLEHFEKDVALEWMSRLQERFNKVMLFIPLGHDEQTGDKTGYGAHEYQTHRSFWTEEDIKDMGFDQVTVYDKWHSTKRIGAGFATWSRREK